MAEQIEVTKDFRQELTDLINKCSMESRSNTPDFVLAQFLDSCLLAFDTAVQQRETLCGRDSRPSLPKVRG